MHERSRILKLKDILWRHKIKSVIFAILILGLGPYALSRMLAPLNRITTHTIHTIESKPTREPDGKNPNPDGETDTFNLRIVAYNVAHGRGAIDDNSKEGGEAKRKRIEQIAQFLKDLDADVVVLNEADFCSTWSGHQNQAEAIARSAGYKYQVQQRNLDFRFIYGSWQFGNAILSKYPLTHSQPINYPPEKHWEDWLVGCKRGVVCEVSLDSTSVRVAAVHLEHRSESVRLESAKLLCELAKQTGPPLIIAGDFNSAPTGFPQSTKTKDGQNTIDWIIATKLFQHRPNSIPTPEQYTFSSYSPTSVIDWIMIPSTPSANDDQARRLTFVDYKSIHSELSDHRPVIANIKIPIAN